MDKALQELAEMGRTAAKKAISRLRERRENEPLRRMADRVKEHHHTPVASLRAEFCSSPRSRDVVNTFVSSRRMMPDRHAA